MAGLDVRPEVAWFAGQMEAALRANDHKGGWRNEDALWLLGKLMEEVGELAELIVNLRGTRELVIAEAADVGTLAMMLADWAKVRWA